MKSKTIYCPRCKRKVGAYDGRSTFTMTYSCRKCGKRISFNSEDDEIKIKDRPQREVSSGVMII